MSAAGREWLYPAVHRAVNPARRRRRHIESVQPRGSRPVLERSLSDSRRSASTRAIRGIRGPNDELVDWAAQFWDDPLEFVLQCFPWGQPGTPLAAYKDGPDIWQREVLGHIRDQIRAGVQNVRVAIASGHGVGKGALAAWLVIWFISTRGHPQIVVTANTGKQLNTKTWREVAKWNRMALNGHWFKWTATKFMFRGAPEDWFAAAIEWSEHNADAFQGTHDQNVMYVFDEASAIADGIWEVSEGAMTQAGSFWIVLGNPTKNKGRFRQCWTKFRRRWTRWNLDARRCRMSTENRTLHDEWIKDYGEDSDFVRVRVKGMFPRVSAEQFIGTYLVEQAQLRKIDRKHIPRSAPRLMGIDPGAGGEESSAVVCVQGNLLIPESIKRYSIADSMQLANQFGHLINDWMPDTVFIDAHGIGQAIYFRLIQLGFDNVVPVYWGSIEDVLDRRIYGNQRIETWARMRDWLAHASVPDDVDLMTDLTTPELVWDQQHRMWLESKKAMKARGADSPHTADALALCFSQPVPVRRDENYEGAAETEPPYG